MFAPYRYLWAGSQKFAVTCSNCDLGIVENGFAKEINKKEINPFKSVFQQNWQISTHSGVRVLHNTEFGSILWGWCMSIKLDVNLMILKVYR